MTNFKKGLRTFNLTGRLRLTNNTFNIDKQKDGSNYIYSNASLSLDCGNGNVFCNLVGGHFVTGDNMIYALGVKEEDGKIRTDYSKQVKVKYDDRFDDSILKTISSDSFVTFNIEKDADGKFISKRFLAKEDGVKYLQSVLTDGMVLNVSGDISFRVDNNNQTLFTLNIKRIYLNEKENPTLRSNFVLTVLADVNTYDSASSADENGLVNLNCYVAEYMKEYRGVEKSVVPLPFDLSVDTRNENWKKVIQEFFRPQPKFVTETVIEGNIMSFGNLQAAALEDQSDDVRQLVELGILSEEEIAKVGTNNNSLVQKMVFARPHVIMQDGKVSIMCDKEKYNASDLEFGSKTEIAKPKSETKKEKTQSEPQLETPKTETDDALFAELFG